MRLVIKEYWHALWFHRPQGVSWLFWPALWALWISNHGWPSWLNALIFISTAFLSYLGLYIAEDIADYRNRNNVFSDKKTPLEFKQVSVKEARALFIIAFLYLFLLSILVNVEMVVLTIFGFALALIYQITKYFEYKSRLYFVVLSLWSVLMVFSINHSVNSSLAYLLSLIVFLWLFNYELMHSMMMVSNNVTMFQSINMKKKIENRQLITAILQIINVGLFVLLGIFGGLSVMYFVSLLFVTGIFIYQQKLMRQYNYQGYYAACLHNRHVGLIIFLGILFSYLF